MAEFLIFASLQQLLVMMTRITSTPKINRNQTMISLKALQTYVQTLFWIKASATWAPRINPKCPEWCLFNIHKWENSILRCTQIITISKCRIRRMTTTIMLLHAILLNLATVAAHTAIIIVTNSLNNNHLLHFTHNKNSETYRHRSWLITAHKSRDYLLATRISLICRISKTSKGGTHKPFLRDKNRIQRLKV